MGFASMGLTWRVRGRGLADVIPRLSSRAAAAEGEPRRVDVDREPALVVDQAVGVGETDEERVEAPADLDRAGDVGRLGEVVALAEGDRVLGRQLVHADDTEDAGVQVLDAAA